MGLDKFELKEEYRTGYDNLVEDFYRPCLSQACLYSRSVGYFSSSVFLLIGPEFIKFAQRQGKMRLVCSPFLSSGDIQALEKGYSSNINKNISYKIIVNEVNLLLSNKELIKNTEALATLITCGILEVKLAFRKKANGIFHEKMGIIEDEDNAYVTFKGSVNETWNGWHERGNYESMDVFCSWKGGRDQRQVKRNIQYFQELWNNKIEGLEVIDFPHVAKERLEVVAKKSIEDIDPLDLFDYFEINYLKSRKNEEFTVNKIKRKRKPLPHQLQALDAWRLQGKRGILEHATGSGKTFTALTALKDHLINDGVALVLVPDRLLHKQWAEEIKEEIPEVTILKAGDGHNRWRKGNRLRYFTQQGDGLGKRIVLATMPTARLIDFRVGICSGEHLMVVADEVHEIGSTENSKAMLINTGPRLGLSATPRRYGDPYGTEKILSYFGSIVEPPFTLVDAINSGRLVEYEYHPEPIHLTAEESDTWEKATREISLEYARSKKDDNGKPVVSPRLQTLLIQRSRIAKKAKAKVPYALKIVKENYVSGESWLIYCEDKDQLRDVMDVLSNSGFEPCEYHTNMVGDPAASLEWFKKFSGIMVSIRCLDQGVDIPQISHAIILASSQNPRQFIQRRGRVLRIYSGKYKATIFDAVVVPLCLKNEPGQLSLLKSELQRSIQFSNTAINKSGANKLISIAIELGIDPEEVGLINTDGIEEIGDIDDD